MVASLLPKVPIFGSMRVYKQGFGEKMTKYQAFCSGFWSVWDFTRPFSEKPRMRRRSKKFDVQWAQELGLNTGYWEEVGNYLYKAIENHENEISSNVTKQ